MGGVGGVGGVGRGRGNMGSKNLLHYFKLATPLQRTLMANNLTTLAYWPPVRLQPFNFQLNNLGLLATGARSTLEISPQFPAFLPKRD
ncbi:MAG: hypothetical protein F6J90_01515 [Moorea sp. SIOASIH]|uniref:hypothetical protein n=1 Tax=Moorena sp. SIOASIH TaxID=2607817 RepID=UPI0013B7684B|nr:hypothetical protein [Moorena sp. SIOASIH]NEO35051.1 hypothetical protein [Moorena sp. SIOASIH]